MGNPRLSVRIPAELRRDLLAIARAAGRSEADIVRDALEQYRQGQISGPSCLEIAKDSGILGSGRDLPADLSVNPQHMDGFGGG
jgi:hypothetical protein